MRRALAIALALLAGRLSAATLMVEDFEKATPRLGWQAEHDDHGLGTVLLPDPFIPEAGGAPGSPRGCGRIHGHLGLNQAPWVWAQLRLALKPGFAPADLGAYRSLRFWAKGDGSVHRVRLIKASIVDSDHYGYSFAAPAQWTLVELPLDAFRQAGWGKPVDRGFGDVTAVEFSPSANDADFDLSVDAVAFSDQAVELKPRAYDTRGWWPYPGVDVAARRGTALDLSGRLDAPAGMHGRAQAKGEGFAFADGTPARFFGVNLVASCNFPTHEQADSMAELLAQMGVNVVRHHHLEAGWSDRNIFSPGGTRALDPESMDRLDYLDAQLIKRGIYSYLDLLVSRMPMAEDGVLDPGALGPGWKVKAEFAPDLLKLQREFIAAFLGHKNPYTGRSRGQEPAVAALELINEDSLFYRDDHGEFGVSGAQYPARLQERFNAWLRGHFKDRAALALSWAPEQVEQRGLDDDEDPWKGSGSARVVASWQGEAWKALSPRRVRDERRFTYDLQAAYYADMAAQARKAGYRGLITGSNHWTGDPADLLANAQWDFVDRHAYYAHPQGGWGYSTAIRWEPAPMIKQAGLGIVAELAQRRVKGKPFFATEWQCAAPNDFRADAVLDMGVACAYQDWSAIQFAFRHSSQADLTGFKGPLDNNFDVANQPAQLGLWPAASLLALRGDLKPASGERYAPLCASAALEPGCQLLAPGRGVLLARCGVDFSGGSPAPAALAAGGWTGAEGAPLRHDPQRGLLLIDTPGTQAIVGFGQGAAEHPSRLQAKLDNAYAVLVAQALDTADLSTARRVLVTAVANAVNEGMALSPSGDQLAVVGGPAVLVEPVTGRVQLALPQAAAATVWALDPSGRRRHPVTSRLADGRLGWDLTAADQAMHYEVQVEAVPAP